MGKRKVYYNKSCYFCEYKARHGEYSFHRFPQEPTINKLWKDFCNLTDVDDTRNLFLCSKHFKQTDFALLKSQQPGAGGARLIKNAVPCITKAATPPPQEKEPVKPVELEVVTDLPADSFDIELSIPTQIVVRSDSSPSTTAELTNLASLLTNIQNLSQTPKGQPALNPTQLAVQSHQTILISDPGTVLPNQTQNTIESAAVSTVSADPQNQIQFLSETEQAFEDAQEFLRKETTPAQTNTKKVKNSSTKSSDVVSLEKAKKTIKFLKSITAKRSRQMVVARDTIRRLRKRMEFCKRMVADVVSKDVAERIIEILRTYSCVLFLFLNTPPLQYLFLQCKNCKSHHYVVLMTSSYYVQQ